MKKNLLAIIIFINAFTIAYSQCTVPTSLLITGSSTISICEGTAHTLSGVVTVPGAAANGDFTYSWIKGATVIVPPTIIAIDPNTATSIPSYIGGPAVMADAGTYVLRIEDGSVGNSVCYKEASVVVNVYPKPTITGTLYVCEESTTQLTGSGTPHATVPIWSSTTTVATVSNTGMVTGIAAGTSDITYMNSNGCTQTATVTVNPIPTITGDLNVCLGQTTQLTGTDMPSLTTNWISSTPSVATASHTGVVTGVAVGTSTVTYITNKGCIQTATVTVNSLPRFSGTLNVCEGSTTQLTASGTPSSIDTWTSASPNIANIDNTGLVTGLTTGTSVITYMNTNGCTQTATVTVNPIPTITGPLNFCHRSTSQLTGSGIPNATTPWVSATPAIVTINNNGLMSAPHCGPVTITYITNAGCRQTAAVTVHCTPTISGRLQICSGSTTQLTGTGIPAVTDAWTSASPTVATVNNTGLVTGLTSGTSVIRYTNSNGCSQTCTVTVNPIPTITGTLEFCEGSTTQLIGSATAHLTTAWVSLTPLVATVNVTGRVTGITPGTSVIMYTTTNGCIQTATVTVNPKSIITGILDICEGSTTQLIGSGTPAATDAWTTSAPTVATVDNTGLVIGLKVGTSIITYTNITGCIFTATVNVVNTSLAPSVSITANPGSTICSFTDVTFKANGMFGGTAPTYEWSSSVNGLLTATTDSYTTNNLIDGEIISVKMNSTLSCISPLSASNSINLHVVSLGSAPVVSIAADKTTICSNGYTTFTATASNGGTAPLYEWSINGASQGVPTSSPSFSTTALTSSFDVVSVRLISNSPCASPTTANASMSINVTTGIGGGAIGSDQTICYNTIPAPITEITAPTSIVGTPTYQWEAALMASGPFVAIPTASSPNFTSNVPITQDVYIRRITTDPGSPAPCNTATSNTIHITVRPQLVAGVIASDETICSGTVPTAITQTTAPTGGTETFTYQWQSDLSGSFQDIVGVTSLNYTPTALIATTRFQRLETSGICGTVTSNVVTKTVTTQEVATVSIEDPGQTCNGDIVLVKCQATNVGPTPIYNWYVNSNLMYSNSPTPTNYNLIIPFKNGDEVWVELISSDICSNTSSVISNKITLDLIPCTVPNSIYTITNINVLLQPYVSNSIPNLIDYTYLWTTTDGSVATPAIAGPNPITPGQQNAVYSVTNQTGFTYTWSITGGTIVSGQNTNSVTVDWDNMVSSPIARATVASYSISVTETNQANQSQTTTLDLTTTTTGNTLSQAQSGINVFPNPTTGSFNIEMPESGVAVSYEILDLTGRSVGSGTFTSTGGDQKIDADLGAGMYQVVLKYNKVVTCVRLSKVQ